MLMAMTAAMIGGIWPFGGPCRDSMARSIADRLVSAISWPWLRAATNALRVFGFCSAQDLVTTYPWMGKLAVAPWLRSASGIAPNFCSAAVANGSGMAAAEIFPAASSAAIFGNGIGWVGKRTWDSLIPF